MTDDQLIDAIRRFALTVDQVALDLGALRARLGHQPRWTLTSPDGQTLDECAADTIGRAAEIMCPAELAGSDWSAPAIDLRAGPGATVIVIAPDGLTVWRAS